MQTNDSETVKEVTSKAFKCLPDIKQAISELTKLKAVGPATASGMKHRTESTEAPTVWMQGGFCQLVEKRAHDKGSRKALLVI